MLLGHRSLRSTQHYTYVSTTAVRAAQSPLEFLDQKFTYLEISRLFGTQFSWGWVSSSLQSPVPRGPGPASEVAQMSVQFDVSVRSRTCLVLYFYRRPDSSQLLCSMSRVVFFPAQNVLHYVLMCDTED